MQDKTAAMIDNQAWRLKLKETYERLGSQRLVAEEYGVSQGTISLWLKLCGFRIRQVWVVEDAYDLTAQGRAALAQAQEQREEEQ